MLRYVPRTGLLEEVADILKAAMPRITSLNLANVNRRRAHRHVPADR